MVWYSHLFQKFPQFIVIHTVKGFGIVTKAEIDVPIQSVSDERGDGTLTFIITKISQPLGHERVRDSGFSW